jgi:maltose O-acetyltransferase
VGENSVIGAGAVVTKDIPANSLVAGVPAKVIRSLEDGLDTTQIQPQINAD